jgi:predicted HicB family RNase H-like nuclease
MDKIRLVSYLEKRKRIQISVEVYEKLSNIAEQKGISIDDLANQLLENAVN